jgi:hypothetical protein
MRILSPQLQLFFTTSSFHDAGTPVLRTVRAVE